MDLADGGVRMEEKDVSMSFNDGTVATREENGHKYCARPVVDDPFVHEKRAVYSGRFVKRGIDMCPHGSPHVYSDGQSGNFSEQRDERRIEDGIQSRGE